MDETTTEQLPAFLRRRNGRLWAKFNLNATVRFKPNKVVSSRLSRRDYQYDGDGYYLAQGWMFMRDFGPKMVMGLPEQIEMTMEFEVML